MNENLSWLNFGMNLQTTLELEDSETMESNSNFYENICLSFE